MESAAKIDILEAAVSQDQPQCTAPELLLKVVLAGTLSHYETCGMIDDKRLEHMLLAGKQILYKSHQESDVRYEAFLQPFSQFPFPSGLPQNYFNLTDLDS